MQVVVYFLQALSALIIASVLRYYFRLYNRNYLKYWSFSFASLAVYLILSMTIIYFSRQGIAYYSPQLFLLSLLKMNAGYLQISWLLFGIYLLYRHDNPTTNTQKYLIIGVTFLATTLSTLYAFDPQEGVLRNVIRSGSRYLLGGISFAIVSAILFYFIKTDSLGKRLLAWMFLIYGLEMAFLGFLNVRVLFGYDWTLLAQIVPFHGIFELLLYPTIGLSLVIWFLDIERLKRQKLLEKLSSLDQTDPLTGLVNRFGLEKNIIQWQQAHLTTTDKVLLVLFGIDRFKRINDEGGIRKGDEVLIALADRMNQNLAAVLRKARISGDVFACILNNEQANMKNLEWLRRRLSRPLFINQQKIHIDISVGAAWLTSHDDCDEVMIKAQRALQQAKVSGGKHSLIFDSSMPEEKHTLERENELHKALAEDQFKVYLQPIYNAQTEEVIGFEALTRWLHPEQGILSPVQFIPHMSQLQLMPQLDLWMLNQAVELLLDWKKKNLNRVSIAVNLSAEGLLDNIYLEKADSIIKRLGKEANILHIEITENSAMKSIHLGNYALEKLHEFGVEISIDDFGTGYSSLNYLKTFPSDKIKFDSSFINEMIKSKSSRTILRSLVPLCQQLGKKVVAEGIESQLQLEIVKDIGFDQLQGYYFSKPMTVDKALLLLRNSPKFYPIDKVSNTNF